jgi:hypothetical protein
VRRIIEEVTDSSKAKMIGVFVDFSNAFDSVRWVWIRAVLLYYNVPPSLVDAIMSLYHGASTKVKYDDVFTDFIPLSTGVLQGDTLAPYLFVIVLDYVLRSAILDESMGLKVANSISRSRGKAKYITDRSFADDIFLTSDCHIKVQAMLLSIESVASKVGLRINVPKTEYILVGALWSSVENVEIRLASGVLRQVQDFKYLGSWIMSSSKDFEIRRALAWKACTRLVKIWKSDSISKEVKITLFRACVESVLLYNAVTWTMTATLEKRLDGCYTKLLRYALGYKWSDYISNNVLYGHLRRVSSILLEKQLIFAGHCVRSDQPVRDLVLWDHSQMTRCKCTPGAGSRGNSAKLLLKRVGKVDGLVCSDVELHKLMQDREAWRIRVKAVVNENLN